LTGWSYWFQGLNSTDKQELSRNCSDDLALILRAGHHFMDHQCSVFCHIQTACFFANALGYLLSFCYLLAITVPLGVLWTHSVPVRFAPLEGGCALLIYITVSRAFDFWKVREALMLPACTPAQLAFR
jgi:hypothetical protein